MPCRDDGQYQLDTERLKGTIHMLTALLCEACALIGKKPMSEALQGWWENHQQQDAARRQREQKQYDQLCLRQQALAKLTEEERAVLNI